MKAPIKTKVTLMLDREVYEGLKQKVGSRGMGAYVSNLARPHVVVATLEASYQALAVDKESRLSARAWEHSDTPIEAENIWQL